VDTVPKFAAAVETVSQSVRKDAGSNMVKIWESIHNIQQATPWLSAFYGHAINARHRLANYIGAKREAARIARIIVPVPGKTLLIVGDGGKAAVASPISGVSGSRQAVVLDAVCERAGPENTRAFTEFRSTVLHAVTGERMENMIGFVRLRSRNYNGRAPQRLTRRISG
jgi:hypothetical protein